MPAWQVVAGGRPGGHCACSADAPASTSNTNIPKRSLFMAFLSLPLLVSRGLGKIPACSCAEVPHHTPAGAARQAKDKRLSNLFRNVPFLTSLEVSPFPVLLLSGSLALPGAQPCGARRAERLGRSAGQGQRRARRGRRLSGRFLLCPATGRLPPRVIRWRPPLPPGPRPTRCGSPLAPRLHPPHARP